MQIDLPCRKLSSIKNKVADTTAIVDQYKPDIILGNESWLYPDIKSSEIFPDNYNIYRKDRISDNHGGVFHAVKKDIKVTHRDDLNANRSFRQRVSSLILKPIRQLCRYASECNEQHFYARNQTNIILTQSFFKLRECSIKKRRFIFYR